jgi:hypothetical protein
VSIVLPGDSTSRRRALGAFALVVVPYLLLVAHFDFVTDDAFINFRFAKHLADGAGFRFNPGVDGPVEGTSEFLWVVVLAVVEWLGLDPTVWARVLSIACGIVLLWRLERFVVCELRASWLAAVLGIGAVALLPPFAAWSTGGLSTMPFALMLFALYEHTCGPRAIARARTGGVVIGAFACVLLLLRAEALPWVVTLLASAWIQARRAKDEKIGRAHV